MANNHDSEKIMLTYDKLSDCERVIREITRDLKNAYELMKKLTVTDSEELSEWQGRAKNAFLEKYGGVLAPIYELCEQQEKNAQAIHDIIELYKQNEEIIVVKANNLDDSNIFGEV